MKNSYYNEQSIIDLEKKLECLNNVDIRKDLNYFKIPITVVDQTTAGVKQFNDIYLWLKDSDFNYIVRTPSGGISIDRKNFKPPMWDYREISAGIEITLVTVTNAYRIQYRKGDTQIVNDRVLSGRKAFSIFRAICERTGIDLEKYAVENGFEIKKTIPSPLIWADRMLLNETFSNVHHIDLHAAYPSGLAITHPEFRPLIEMLYHNRKTDATKKDVLNYTVGMMQSRIIGAVFAQLSKDAIIWAKEKVLEIAAKVKENNGVILLYNTDGFWYQGDIYHGEGEGLGLGEWSNDHCDCIFRMASKGKYEYIENGVYKPVVRGKTSYDDILPRAEWNWGDIYNCSCAVAEFDEELGLIITEEL